MKAIILAGGEGRRLRPLTDTLPKPLLEIAGIPVLTYLFRLLHKNGIEETVIAAGYCSQRIIEYYGSEAEGVRLFWHVEDTPRGTAGCVRDIAKGYTDDLLVLSGDAICEFDLAAAVRYHRMNEAKATLLLSRAEDPGEFGIVCCEHGGEGRITGFIEKPHISQCVSDMVNSGVYVLHPSVLENIPEDKPYDFGRNLFPLLLRNNEKIYGLYDSGFWCDIGDVKRYVEVNRRYSYAGKSVSGGAWKGSTLRRGGIIVDSDTPAVTGSDCRIASSAMADGAVIGSGSRIGENSDIRDSVIGEYVTVGRDCVIGPDAVIGGTCSIGDYCRIGAGVHLPAGSVLDNGESISSEGTLTKGNNAEFTENGFRLPDIPSSLPVLHALGGVIGTVYAGSPVCVLRGAVSVDAYDTLINGIVSSGGNCISGGAAFDTMASYAASRIGFELLLTAECRDGYIYVSLYGKNGLYIGRDRERKLRAAFGEYRKSRLQVRGELGEIYGIRSSYLSHIMNSYGSNISCGDSVMRGYEVIVKFAQAYYPDGDCSSVALLRQAISGLGFNVRRAMSGDKPALALEITPDGRYISAYVITPGGQRLAAASHFEIAGIICRHMPHGDGRTILLPVSSPRRIADILIRGGYRVEYYPECAPCGYDERKNSLDKRLSIYADGCSAAVRLIGIIAKSGILPEQLISSSGESGFAYLELVLNDRARPSILRRLGRWSEEGVVTHSAGCNVRIIPRTYGYTVACEGENAQETAEDTAAMLREMHMSGISAAKAIPQVLSRAKRIDSEADISAHV